MIQFDNLLIGNAMRKRIQIPEKIDFFESMSASRNYDLSFMKKDQLWQEANRYYNRYFIMGKSGYLKYRIPKIIHQIWLGSVFPKKYNRWVESWKKYHPDWEYHLWSDKKVEKLDMQKMDIFNETSNFGAKSDILRYELLYKYGGLYIDTDFECFKPFDYLHVNGDFYAGIGFGKELTILNSIIGSIPQHPIIKELLDKITEPIQSSKVDSIHKSTGPWAFSNACISHIFDNKYRNILLPVTYFYPFPNDKLHIQNETKILRYRRKESMALHYWEVSWVTGGPFIKKLFSRILRYIPAHIKKRIKNLVQ